MTKSDAGWSVLRNVLSYKSIATGGFTRVVPERYRSRAIQFPNVLGLWVHSH
jgi:hypothetical protein